MLLTPTTNSTTVDTAPIKSGDGGTMDTAGALSRNILTKATRPTSLSGIPYAALAISLAVLLLMVFAGLAAWQIEEQSSAAERTETSRLQCLAQALAPGVEAMLGQDDLATVRRIIADTVLTQSLTSCRLILPDGKILATTGGADRVTASVLPEAWSGRTPPPEPSISTGSTARTANLRVAGRGVAYLQLTSVVPVTDVRRLEIQTLACGVGALAVAAFGFGYRRQRKSLRGLQAVHEALLDLSAAGSAQAAIPLNADLGPEAAAWNLLLAERTHGRKDALAERAREALGRRRQSRGDLDAACDAMSQGLLLIDDQLRIKYTNGAAASFLRIDREKLSGMVINQAIQIDSVKSVITAVAGGSRRRAVVDVERAADAASGTPGGAAGVLRFSVRPVRREDSASAMIVIEDITQQKAAEEARHAFVAQATHELRTPLTNIRLYVETAIEDGDDDPAIRAQALNVINGETRRLERIVSEMLSVAEIEAGHFKLKTDDVRLDALFEELKHDYAEQAKEKKITLSFLLPPKLPVLIGDRDKVAIAMHNLVGNALKYTPDGGGVTVRVEADEKNMNFAVADTGIGIAADDCEKVFERFFRASDRRVAKITGTGLGLTIAREAARLHGGDITVESKLDKGSTFTLSLPLKAA